MAQGVWDDLYEPLATLASEYERGELALVQDFLRRANAILGGGEDDVASEPAEETPAPSEPIPEEREIFRSRLRPRRPANRLR